MLKKCFCAVICLCILLSFAWAETADTIAPTISGVRSHTIYVGDELDYVSGVSVSDNSGEEIILEINDACVNPAVPGEYTVTYRAADSSGNIVLATAKITVLADTEPPVISGTGSYEIYIGDKIDYLSGITVSDNRDPSPLLVIDESKLNLQKAGAYPVIFTARDSSGNESTAVTKITVRADKEKPILSGVQDYEVYVGESVDYISGVKAADNRDGEIPVLVEGTVDFSAPGRYTVRYACADSSGNTAKASATIRVKQDKEAPVIHGAKDITVEIGSAVSYKKGVSVTDNRDSAPKLTIDNSKVNLNQLGKYKVVYTAEDSAGNKSSVTIRVTVAAEVLTEEDIELIWPMADEILAEIITDDMSPMQKAFKIYGWTRKHIRYNGVSDKSHWVMGAYEGFSRRRGDCFTYFSVAKALLTRAGIDNIDVVKSDTRYSQHFWSLIDIGSGWYHFDSCQFSQDDARFFMVTDAELKKWDKENRNAHPFDETLYPERATESVQKQLNYYKYEVKE